MRKRLFGLCAGLMVACLGGTGCAGPTASPPLGPSGMPASPSATPASPSEMPTVHQRVYTYGEADTLAQLLRGSDLTAGFGQILVAQVKPLSVRFDLQEIAPVPMNGPDGQLPGPGEPTQWYTPDPTPWNVVTATVEEVFLGALTVGDTIDIAHYGGPVNGAMRIWQDGEPQLREHIGESIVLALWLPNVDPGEPPGFYPDGMYYQAEPMYAMWSRNGKGNGGKLTLLSAIDGTDASKHPKWASITVQDLKQAIADRNSPPTSTTKPPNNGNGNGPGSSSGTGPSSSNGKGPQSTSAYPTAAPTSEYPTTAPTAYPTDQPTG